MKRAFLLALMLLMTAAYCAEAAYYQWVDADGVVHFTDNSAKIPSKYRKKAKKVKLYEEAAPAESAPAKAPAQQPAAQGGSQEFTPGGHPEQWWRQQYSALRGELKALQDGMPAKQEKLIELRRKRAIYMRIKDREAVNAQQDDIAGDENHILELQKKLDALDMEASKAGVPNDWRQ